jgi:polygalacturonase
MLPAQAQDSRHVPEPRIPRACAVLDARLAAVNGVLSADAEENLDTARIQQ